VCPVGEAEVDDTLNIMRKQRATYEDVTRPAANGDVVVVDFAGTVDGVAFDGGSAQDYAFTLGQGRMLPEFETAVSGMAVGASKVSR
jgi:trigger factor